MTESRNGELICPMTESRNGAINFFDSRMKIQSKDEDMNSFFSPRPDLDFVNQPLRSRAFTPSNEQSFINSSV